MAAQTPIWTKIPWQCPVMHRMEDLHCSAINKGKEKPKKMTICLADPTRQVVFLIQMVNFLITSGWAGPNQPLLKLGKTKCCRNILDATEPRCTNLTGDLLFEQFFHISILRKCCKIQVSLCVEEREGVVKWWRVSVTEESEKEDAYFCVGGILQKEPREEKFFIFCRCSKKSGKHLNCQRL